MAKETPAVNRAAAPSTEAPAKKHRPGTASWMRAHRLELSVVAGIVVLGTASLWILLALTGQSLLGLIGLSVSGEERTKGRAQANRPAAVERRLDGSLLPAGKKAVYPVAVMIENLPSVRPQASLGAASVVYEALVEGFSTRFMALYDLDKDMPVVGPVRSARPYYLEWLSEYDALYAHAGGSPEAMEIISGFQMKDLNGIGLGARYFYREPSRAAPHNLYTSSELLTFALRDLQLQDAKPSYRAWTFKDDAKKADRPESVPDFVIGFSGGSYEVRYQYDRERNDYLRLNGGVEHTDANTGEPIHVKNAIAQIIPPVLDVGEKGRLRLDVTGSGRAVIARDGDIIDGTWTKESRTDRTIFRDADGTEVAFNIGPTWIAAVLETQSVTY